MPPREKRKTPPPAAKPAKRTRKAKVEVSEESASENSSDVDSHDSGDSNDDDDDDDDDNDDDDEEEEDNDGDEEDEDQESDDNSEKPTKNSKKAKSTAAKKRATAKKSAKEATSKSNKSKSGKSDKKKSTSTSEGKVPRIKSLKTFERLEEARKAYKWWEAEELPNGINWKYLEHKGIAFAPEYVPHRVPLLYKGEEVVLTPAQEELATFYAAIPLDGPQLGNPKTAPVFQNNFFEDFKAALGSGHKIKTFSNCDFAKIREHLQLQKDIKKAATDEEKAKRKDEKEKLALTYGYALIDGRLEKMGNYNMEPPSLFRGRGEHPKTGTVKQRCLSESVSLNLSEDACVPKCHLPGHAWERVQHDPMVTWLCAWTENVQSQNKYVMLAASSSFKGKSDQDKYGKAIQLHGCIHKVRADYTSKIKDSSVEMRELGTAMWVIDKLALRVGGEKGEDEADTVGCCSLRVEHITFTGDMQIELEFLGKDSMLFKQTIDFEAYGDLGRLVFKNLKDFCKGKDSSAQVFESLTPPELNKHLNSLMKGLTAKVFRTYNASITLEKELPTAEELEGLSIQDKVLKYNAANRQVAILCNHQRTVSKATEVMFENLNEKLQTLNKQLNDLKKWKTLVPKKKESQIELRSDDAELSEKVQMRLQKAIEKKEKAKSVEDRLAAAQLVDEAKAAVKCDQKRRFDEKHMFKLTPSSDSIASRIEKWEADIRKLELDIRNRDENKEFALGTSKINYMDPRISVAWCKRCEVPIDKVFAKTLRDKFNWAMAVPLEWKFE